MHYSHVRSVLAPATLVLVWATVAALAGPATSDGPADSNKWLEAEKIRCISYYQSFPPGEEEELVKKARELGFNSLITMGNLLDVDEKTKEALSLAGKHDMHVFCAFHLRDALRAAALDGASSRRFTGEDGIKDQSHPCPFDEDDWNAALGARAVSLAKLSKEYPAAAGLLFDVEDYGKRTRTHADAWMGQCYCDECFDGFARAQGLSTDHEAVPAENRKGWLSSEGLLEGYRKHQHEETERICRNIRKEIDKINPDFLVACYPWGDSNYFEDYIRGLGTERAPFLLFDYHYRGYKPDFAMRARELRDTGLHVLFVPGQGCFIGVDLGPMWTAAHCYYSALANDGYWIYDGAHPILLEEPAWDGSSVPGTAAQWEKWMKSANEELDRRMAEPGYQSSLPLLRDPLLHPAFRSARNVRQAIPESRLRPLRHSDGAEIRFQKLTDLGIPWQGREILLRGNEAGDYLEFEVEVSVSDTYSIEGFVGTGPKRGIVQLLVDGEPAGEPVDLYSPTLELFPRPSGWAKRGRIQLLAPLGQTTLAAGSYTFRLQLVGRNRASEGYDVGIRGLMLMAVTDAPFIKDWLVIGPFPGGDYRGLRKRFPPEKEIALDKAYEGQDGEEVTWKRVQASADDWLALRGIRRATYSLSTATEAEADAWLDFRRILGTPSGVAYALAYVDSPRAQLANLLLASVSGTRMWVNGEMVWKFEVSGGVIPAPGQVVVPLRAGSNEVLVKVEQNWHWPWGVHLRFSDPSRELTYQTRDPGQGTPD